MGEDGKRKRRRRKRKQEEEEDETQIWETLSPPSSEPSTSQLHFGTVVAQVLSVRRGGVAFIKARVLGLQATNLEHHGISLQALHLQVPGSHARPKHSVGELAILGADDAQGSRWGLRSVHEPFKVLLGRAVIGTHVARDRDSGANHTVKRALGDMHLPGIAPDSCGEKAERIGIIIIFLERLGPHSMPRHISTILDGYL